MTSRIFVAALCGVSCFSLTQAAPALAQQAESSSPADIIVTARRVEERLQDVPISITVLSQQQLANRNVVTGADLAISTPSLQVSNTIGSTSTSFSLRGLGASIGTDPSVGVYFADAVSLRGGSISQQTGNGAGPGAFFDLQNIQVLKGPQGTLFGRNSTGGAILLVPQRPTSEFEGYVEGSYGNYDMHRLQAVLNAPLGENIRLRLGVDRQKRDGYVRNLSGVGPKGFNDVDYVAVRASLVIDVTPDLENYTVASYLRSEPNGDEAHLFKANLTDPGAGLLAVLAAGQLRRFGNADRLRTTANPYEDVYDRQTTWQVVNTTTLQASDNLAFKNIAMYGELKSNLKNPLFGNFFDVSDVNSLLRTNYPVGTLISFAGNVSPPGGDTTAQYTFSDEARIEGTAFGGALTFQGGGFFEYSGPTGRSGSIGATLLSNCPQRTLFCAAPIPSATPGIAGSGANITDNETSFRNIGIYAQGTYTLTDQLSLTAGARYTWARTKARASGRSYFYAFSPAIALTPQNPLGSVCSNGAEPDCNVFAAQSSSAPTWTIGLDYKPTDDILAYAKWSRGFRQGGAAPNAPPNFRTFEEESVDAYEVGLKTTLSGALRGTFNVSAFYNDITDQQLLAAFTSLIPGLQNTTAIVNAGGARVYGFEVDTSLSPFTGFTLDAGYTYLNSELTAITFPPLTDPRYVIGSQGREGDDLLYTPRHKLVTTATYTLPLDESIGRVSLSATYSYTSSQIFTYTRRGPQQIAGGPGKVSGTSLGAPRNLVDLAFNWNRIGGSPFDLTVFGSNVFDKKYTVFTLDLLGPGGFQAYQVGQPRLYGARLRYSF